MGIFKNKNRKEGEQTKVGKAITNMGGAGGVLGTISDLTNKGASLVNSMKAPKDPNEGFNIGQPSEQPDDTLFGMPKVVAISLMAILGLIVVFLAFRFANKK